MRLELTTTDLAGRGTTGYATVTSKMNPKISLAKDITQIRLKIFKLASFYRNLRHILVKIRQFIQKSPPCFNKNFPV